ncbi:hypothetical protein Tco_0663131 [Tanacetum coccineum]
MDLETTQTNTTTKLPILKQGEYDMWRLRIELYFQVQDYALWDVIENGNSFKPVAQTTTNADGTSTSLLPGPVTTEEKAQKKNDVKARSMLLMALPNQHLMTFNQYKDAKTLFAAIQTRFSDNEVTKKTQKTLLKQIQLAILGENISQEDLNLKFLRSLPSEWNTHVVVWRNKPDLDTMSFDDLYNNFKIVKQEVKGTASSSSSSSSQNMAFVSSPSSTNEVNTAYGVSTANTQVSPASTQVSTASTQVSTANLSDDTVYAFLASQPNGSQLVYEDLEQIHEDDIEEMDLKWQLALLSMRTRRGPRNQDSRNRNQDSSRRTVNVEETSSKAMVAIDGAGFDWSYMADDEVPTNMALMAFSDSEFNKSEFNLATYKRGLASVEEQLVFYKRNEEFQQPEFEGYGPKPTKSVSEDTSNEVKESLVAPLVEELVSDDKSQSPRGNQRNWNNKKSEQLGSDFVMYNKACFVYGSFDHVQANCNYHQRERVVSGNNYTRVNYNYSAKKTHPSAQRNMFPRAVLMKTCLRSLNTARPVNIAHPKTIVYTARPMSHFSKSAQSTVKRPYQTKTALTNKNSGQKVNTAKGKFYTLRPKAINTARPNSAAVNAVRANQVNAVKASTCWVWRPTKLNSVSITLKRHNYVDARGRSKHMTGNMSYLSDFKEFDEGYVTFRGRAKVGENYHVLFTDTGCFVLSPDFKLANESQVLLKVPRKNNMYSVDMNNIVPKVSLTCLVTKATLDESMLWPLDAWSIFTSVFFLETKDKTSGILKSFITEVENLVDKKNVSNDETQPLQVMLDKKDDEGVCKESGIADQEKSKNSTQGVNTAGPSINTESNMFSLGDNATLEATHADFFGDETEVDMSNITTSLSSFFYSILQVEDPDVALTEFYKVENTYMVSSKPPKSLVMQKEDGIFISQDKYVDEIMKRFGFSIVRIASTPIETSKQCSKDAEIFRYLKGQPKLGLCYPKDSPFDLESSILDVTLLHTRVANSTTEAEYVAAANCYGQVLWIQNQMLDYGYNFINTKIFIDNERTICIVKNPVFHSKTKHIEIRHHFIRDSYEKRLIQVIKIHTDHNVADLLTKALDVSRMALNYETIHEERGDIVERATTTATSLDAEQGSGNINRTQSTVILNDPFPWGISSGGSPRRQDTIGDRPVQSRFERLSKQSNELPLSRVNTLGSGEDSMKLQELMDLCTKLSDKVLDLENVKNAQALEIQKLKKEVKAKIGGMKLIQDERISWFQEDSETQKWRGIVPSFLLLGVSISIAEPLYSSQHNKTTILLKISLTISQNPYEVKMRIKGQKE